MMRRLEIHFDAPAPAVAMASDLIEGLDVRPILDEGEPPGVTLRVVVPDHLARMLREVAAVHGGTVVAETAPGKSRS